MTDLNHQRAKTSHQQLSAVSQARQFRLRSERTALAVRERALSQAMASQEMEEALLVGQNKLWSDRWQAWVQAGGQLSDGVILRHDRDLLRQMGTLIARRRTGLLGEANGLRRDLSAWVQRWHGAEALNESLATRARALAVSLERANERQRDEDTLSVRFSSTRIATACATPV